MAQDIATVLLSTGTFDWVVAGSDLSSDDGLDTAIAISLFTDRIANADDVLPDNSGDRRGWWGDAYLPPRSDGTPDFIGSRLWLLERALQIPATAQRAQTYVKEALVWLPEDGVAGVSVPLPTFPGPGFMRIVVVISQQGPTGTVDRRFVALWNMTRATVSTWGFVPSLAA